MERETLPLDCEVKIKLFEDGVLPTKAKDGDVCYDCHARLAHRVDMIRLPARSRCPINLGFALELPEGWEAVIRPRSGLTSKGIDIAVGTIDFGYRGEVKACIINNTDEYYDIHMGDRICQMAIRKVPVVKMTLVTELSDSERGDAGFGSSGV